MNHAWKAGRGNMGPAERGIFAVVNRRFRPEQCLSEEGAFLVQLATDIRIGGSVVVKRPKDPANPRSLTSLAVEAAALSRLIHPGVPRLIGAALDSDDPYIAMEHVSGMRYNINNILDDRTAYVVRLAISACSILSDVHKRGVIHRDICPANLILSHDRTVLSLIDFGVAYVPGMPDLGADRLVGRPDFMAPEQAMPGASVDGRADIYSLGVLSYMFISGRSPYVVAPSNDEATLSAHRDRDAIPLGPQVPWVPASLSAAIMKAIARDPRSRYQEAEEFSEALSRCLELVERP